MPHSFTRRDCLGLGLGLAVAARAAQPSGKRYRAAIIGHTGHGGYGHNWVLTWNGIPPVEVVAVADPDEKGRAAAVARSHALRGYADYREMLRREKPDIVNIAPRWADQHLAMFRAAAEAGAHIIIEKPFAPNLPEADAMVDIARRAGIRVQVGHAARASFSALKVREMLRGGALGELVEMRARGKEDQRAGGEDLVVLGSHALDLMRFFAGDPQWVFAHVTLKNADIRRSDAHDCKELVGKVAGDQVSAMFAFDHGVHGFFDSKRAEPQPPGNRCGLTLYGTKGAVFINLGTSRIAEGGILRSPMWMGDKAAVWEPLATDGPEIMGDWDRADRAMALDLLAAIEARRDPICSAADGRWTIEMIAGIYRSQFAGARVAFPLKDRSDPLAG